jgi:NADH-quinone oxidoreductase subunit N
LFTLLILISTLDLLLIGITVEALSLTLYTLIGLGSKYNLTSSIKYFTLGGFVSVLLWLAISLTYGMSNLTDTLWLGIFIQKYLYSSNQVLKLSVILLTFVFLFKLVAFPAHQWAPEVYGCCSFTINNYIMVSIIIVTLTIRMLLIYQYLVGVSINSIWYWLSSYRCVTC